jgi:hypothetical protein
VLTDAEVAQYASAHDEVSCLTEIGGAIAMRPLLIHCSSKAHNLEPRRVLHIEYADSLDFGSGIQLAVV